MFSLKLPWIFHQWPSGSDLKDQAVTVWMRNVPHRLLYPNTLFLAGGAVLEDCGNCETWVAGRHRQLWAQHNRDSLALFLVSPLFSDPLRCNSLHHKLYLPKQVILDCVFSNHEPRCNSPLLNCFSEASGHTTTIQGICQEWQQVE